ncbi:unnamed protein product [Brassica oleracea var. botrytis]
MPPMHTKTVREVPQYEINPSKLDFKGVAITVALKMVAGVDCSDSVVVGRISTKDEGEKPSTWPSDTDVDFKVKKKHSMSKIYINIV